MPDPREIDAIVRGEHSDPHHVLGPHPAADGVTIRVFRPDALTVDVVPDDPSLLRRSAPRVDREGVFEAHFAERTDVFSYGLEIQRADGSREQTRDPFAFLPTLGEIDLHLASEGKHLRLYEQLGAHVRTYGDVTGVSFAVWAPMARRVSVIGSFNRWDPRICPMRRVGRGGIWELFVPDVPVGALYKFEILTAGNDAIHKLDPFAFAAQLRPNTAGVVVGPSTHRWADAEWLALRGACRAQESRIAIYEVHLGSWLRRSTARPTNPNAIVPLVPPAGASPPAAASRDPDDRAPGEWLTYRELAPVLADYVTRMGFTHVELLPIAEHPYDGSWGYQLTGYFAPTARHGTPDDFRFLVDHLHSRGIGVILDWVPAHFPKDAHGLARFDGSALYEHLDPRQGEHPDWGTLIYNFARPEVRNFLVSNALYWLEQFHVDGLRVDAVAAMLYLDYSRNPGEWVPNEHGGRENLDAIAFLKELNAAVTDNVPGAIVIAEESTAWPSVTRPTWLGGLGFAFKWNMGWMHDTLAYFSLDPIHRRFHHAKMTFSLMYAWSEQYLLPFSHDEVVHMKGSLLEKMPGDRWRRFANLRAMLAWMACHPGKKLMFMGGEFGQKREWNFETSLDWSLLDDPLHAGVQALTRDLLALARECPEVSERDGQSEGFRWIDANDSDQSVFSFLRLGPAGIAQWVCLLNATPVVRRAYAVGVPVSGEYIERINTDAQAYGGSGVGNLGRTHSSPTPRHGFSQSISVTLPPLAMLVFVCPR